MGRIAPPRYEYRAGEVRLLTSRKGTKTGLQFDGPFFVRDPVKTYRQNLRLYMERIAQIGEAEVRRRVAGAPRRSPGPSYSGQYIRGRVRPIKGGPQWATTAVVSAAGGIAEAKLDRAHAIRVQASLAGRKLAITEPFTVPASGTRRGYTRRGSLGTTPGHEGTARVFARTKSGLRRAVKTQAYLLLKGLT